MTSNPPDVFSEINAIQIADLWRMLGLPGDPKQHGNMCSPFHPDRSPSFSIHGGGLKWKDHSGEHEDGGDGVQFVAKALDCDHAEVRRWYLERHGLNVLDGQQSRPRPRPAPQAPAPPKVIEWPALLEEGTPQSWKEFADLRGLRFPTVHVMVHSGLLRFLTVDGAKCWCVLDPSHRCAEIRRMDGQLFGKSKAFPLRGVDKSWPVGLDYLSDAPPDAGVLIAEGASDFLSAMDLYVRFRRSGGKERWMPTSMLGAACKQLHPEAERIIRRRPVRLVPDADPAGDAMGIHWRDVLLGMGCRVDTIKLPRGKDLSDVAGQIQPSKLFS
ncbi:toprim domain-containing protein [Luteolibacter sp. Populi]|uniref:toprim domain-containing protein n=1 Tax=Luteolibacter sp. Populi TaxID=3230487 RepID=UPI0034653A12